MTTKELTTISKKLSPVAEKAIALVIKDDQTLKTGVELLSQLNQFNDKITEEKEKVTKPLNEALKAERARWKPTETANQEAIDSIRSKMSKYQTQLVQEQKTKEQKIAERVTKGTLKIETAVSKIEALPTVEKEHATDVGLVQFREVKKFEVMDITMLSPEYILPNDKAITESMKEGKELPGVRYYTEQVPVNYR